jgi:hypothetical protein
VPVTLREPVPVELDEPVPVALLEPVPVALDEPVTLEDALPLELPVSDDEALGDAVGVGGVLWVTERVLEWLRVTVRETEAFTDALRLFVDAAVSLGLLVTAPVADALKVASLEALRELVDVRVSVLVDPAVLDGVTVREDVGEAVCELVG